MSTVPEMASFDPADIVLTALKEEVQRKMARPAPKPRTYVYASEWHPCKRYLFLKLTRPDAWPEFEPETLARFKRGNDRENDLMVWLSQAGKHSDPPFSIVGAQERIEIKGRDGEVVIVGKKDFTLNIEGAPDTYPSEIKAWPELHKRVNRVEDLELSPWTRGAEMQLLSYLYGTNQPEGFLILDTPSLPKFIRVSLEDGLEKMERFLQDAEDVVNRAASVGLDDAMDDIDYAPDFINDPVECRRCPVFGRACSPPLDFGEGATTITDVAIMQDVEREVELHDAAKEYKRLHDINSKRFRDIPEYAIVGECIVKVKRSKKTTYVIPKSVKEQYVHVEPQGCVSVSIQKLPNPEEKKA